MHELGIFIFHRDFRIVDNIGLYESSKLCKKIVPVFIFTPQQISAENKFRSNNAIQFMIDMGLKNANSSFSMYCKKKMHTWASGKLKNYKFEVIENEQTI